MGDDHVHDQIQRLLDARDQKAFSRLLTDSLCSMRADDFNRVRDKLIRKFIDNQRRPAASANDAWSEITARVKSAADEQRDGLTQAEEGITDRMMLNGGVNSSELSLKIVNVRSCGGDGADGSWSNDVETTPSAGDEQPQLKRERLDSSSWPSGHHFTHVDEDVGNEDVTTTNYITIAPIETTPNDDDDSSTATDDDQTQGQYSEVTDIQPASAVAVYHSESRQVQRDNYNKYTARFCCFCFIR